MNLSLVGFLCLRVAPKPSVKVSARAAGMSKHIGPQSTLKKKKKKKDEKSSRSYLWLHSVTSKAKSEEAVQLIPVSFLGCSTSKPSCQAVRKLRPHEGNVNVFQLMVPTEVLADITVCLHVR